MSVLRKAKGKGNMYTVELTDYEMELCRMFSTESARTQQHVEFGQRGTFVRDDRETARDTMIGKMAEVAVARLIDQQFGLRLPVNFQVYPTGGDADDFCINGWHIDVKATRTGHFLFYEVHKMRRRQLDGTMPDVIIACRTPWDMQEDIPKGNFVHVAGCVSRQRLMHSLLLQGERIPGTMCRMQTSNYYADFDEVGEFHRSVGHLLGHRKEQEMRIAG